MKLVRCYTVLIVASLFLSLVSCEKSENLEKKRNYTSKLSTLQTKDPIDFGLFCNEMCRESLTLKATRSSIKGTVGLIVSGTFPYGLGTARMAEAAAKKYFPNMKLIIANGNSDPTIQSSIVDNFISKKVKVIVIDLVEKDAVNPALERAKSAGIPIITIDRWTPVKVSTLIKADDVEVGRKAGQQIVKLLQGKGNVIELTGTPASTTTIDRHKGILEAFTGFPDIHIIKTTNADFDSTKAEQVMRNILKRYRKGTINALISHADIMTLGALKAIKEAGREGDFVIVSVDGQNDAIQAVENRDIDADIAYPIVMPMGILAAAKVLAGESIPESIDLEAPIITKENATFYKNKTGY